MFPDGEARAFAVRFARAYLRFAPGEAAGHERMVASFLASGLRDRAAVLLPRSGPGEQVAQAAVAREVGLGGSRALITVASTLQDPVGATRYLTVPVARDRTGGLAVFDLPALSAPPPASQVSASEPGPLSGPEAGAISDLVGRFLAAYLAGGDPSALAYFLAPGARVAAMPAALRLASLDQVAQGEGREAAGVGVVASVHVRDERSGAVYPLRYRLTVEWRDRWQVAGVAEGPST